MYQIVSDIKNVVRFRFYGKYIIHSSSKTKCNGGFSWDSRREPRQIQSKAQNGKFKSDAF